MPEGRRFSEEEVHALLRSASSRQQAQQDHTKLEAGLTLDEVQRIAEDAGIDPHFISAALLDLDSNDPEIKENKYVGGPTFFRIERYIEGRLDEEAQALIVAELRRHFPKKKGKYSQLGSMLDWKVGSDAGTITVHLEPSGDNTRIVWEQNMEGLSVALHMISFFAILITTLIQFKEGLFMPIPAVIALVTYLSMRFLYGHISKKETARAKEAMNAVVQLAQEQAKIPEKATSSQIKQERANEPQLTIEDPDVYDPAQAPSKTPSKAAQRRIP